MKKTFRFSLLMLATAAIFLGCSKDRIEEPEINSYSSPDAFNDQYKQPEQEFVITQDGVGPIKGLFGTKLWVGKNIFMRQDSSDIDYPYTVKLVELYTPKDMILYNMPTVAQGKLLTTGGEIRVRAFKDNLELLLKPSVSYMASMPSSNPTTSMQIYYGKSSGTIIDWTNDVNQVPNSNGPDSIGANVDSSRYDLLLPHLGWINCDYLYAYTGLKTTITFSSSIDDLTNVAKYIYFKDISSVAKVYGNTSGDVPVGGNATVILYAVGANGKMFYFKKDLTITAGETIDVALTETTEANLLTLLGDL